MISPSPKSIDSKTRRKIKDVLLTRQYLWHGVKSEPAFLSDLYDLHELPSHDQRYQTAYQDIQQHRERNSDGDDSWVFDDPRFEVMSGSDQNFLEFVAHTLHPRVRRNPTTQTRMLKQLNTLLDPCGYELYKTPSDIGPDTFSHRHTSMADVAPLHDRRSRASIDLTYLGGGSYANVYSYVDPNYGTTYAIKRARKNLDGRELERFKQEFNILTKLSSPHVVEVYRYDEERNEYLMEFCDQTLEDFVKYRNSQLVFPERKRIALQFLRGLNHIHSKDYLHRDLSYRNVLVKVYDGDEVLVKIADLGLVKDLESDFTRTETDMKGTLRDPYLENFRDFGLRNEMWAIGMVLQYIFTGRERLERLDTGARIVEKCTDRDPSQRYDRVLDLIADVEALEDPAAAPA
ncbi:protein kinase domain-containing protein [Prescottella equi]|uniref:AbiJ-related protein n=1 Tax=Rhodococcus hoagii TaxID=43767 RepID=UPI002742890B|nr:protein kinase [Prescottella equi]MDP8017119.1 protein kinase [Prescottella equi]